MHCGVRLEQGKTEGGKAEVNNASTRGSQGGHGWCV